MDKDKELELLKQWKNNFIKALCKYDCSSVEEIYQQGRADAIEELKPSADIVAYEQGRLDAIEEYKKKIEFEYKWLLNCKVYDENVTIVFETLKSYAEHLKEQKNCDHYCHSCEYNYTTEDEEGLYYHHCQLD